ncbi:MAG: type II toxin-antitoxin system VapC family toxin [Verrucomicrobiota bacterium]
MGLILDTSALIEWEKSGWKGIPSGVDETETVILPAVVWAEGLAGVRLAKTTERAAIRRARLEAIRSVAGIEPFTPLIAEHYADIFSALYRIGSLIPQNDIAVAATARSLDFSVLVGPKDESHFRRVPGLKVLLFAA